MKRIVSPFVFIQRGFERTSVVDDNSGQLKFYNTGLAFPPQDGNLIKGDRSLAVYIILKERKSYLSSLSFRAHLFNFSDIQILPDEEVENYRDGEVYEPPAGILIKTLVDPLVYLVENGIRRRLTLFTFQNRKLSFDKIITVTPEELKAARAPKDPYWLPPLDGTLVKPDVNDSVYVIEEGKRRLLSAEVFTTRGYGFSEINILPDGEVALIPPGDPILE